MRSSMAFAAAAVLALAVGGVAAQEAAPAPEMPQDVQPEPSAAPVEQSGSEPAIAEEAPAPLPTIPVQSSEQAKASDLPPEPEGAQLEEITVTASKRSQSLQDVPGSIGALSGKQLEDMMAKGMEDYMKLIPGVAVPPGQFGPDSSPPVIRGISTGVSFGNINAPGNQTAGVFIDDISFGTSVTSLQFPDMSPFDLDGVEVLKGPQGTLFGAQALAGAIRYVTHKPELGLWQAKLQGSGINISGSDENFSPYGAAALNIPIGSSAAIRAAGIYRQAPGFVDVDTMVRQEKDVNSLRQHAERVLGKWNIIDELTLSASYFRQYSNQNDIGVSNRRDDLIRYNSGYKIPGKQQFDLANVVATYEFGWATLLSSTSRKTQNSGAMADITGAVGGGINGTPCDITDPMSGSGPCDGPAGIGGEDQNQFKLVNVAFTSDVLGLSQEFRLVSPDDGDLRWIAGVYFQRDKQLATQVAELVSLTSVPALPPIPIIDTIFGPIDLASLPYFQKDRALSIGRESSVFAEGTYRFFDDWELTAGGRFFRTGYEADVLRYGAVEIAEGILGGNTRTDALVHVASTEQGFNPRLSLKWGISPNVSVYALASKGFQFGGSQLTPPIPGQDIPPTYKSSKLWNYEVGARTDWFSRRLSMDVTVFLERWKDLQIRGATNDPTGLRLVSFFFVTNVGAAESKGIELAVRARPVSDVVWSTSVSLMKAVTTEPFDDPETQQTLAPGTRLPASPRFQMANVLSYTPTFGNWAPGLSLTHAYTGTAYNNLVQDMEIGGFSTLDANLSLLKADSQYQPRLSLSATNLFDTRGVANADGNSARRHIGYIFVRPRTLEMTLEFRFN